MRTELENGGRENWVPFGPPCTSLRLRRVSADKILLSALKLNKKIIETGCIIK